MTKNRKGRTFNKKDMNPKNNKNWKMVCSRCGAEYAMDETVDLSAGHMQEEHPEAESPEFHMIWIGIGPKPKSRR